MFRRPSSSQAMAVPVKKSGSRARRTKRESPSKGSSLGVRFGVLLAAIMIVFMVTWMTYLAATTTVTEISVRGSNHATVEEVTDLSGVEIGDTLFAIDPVLVADRVENHRWIEKVNVTRWPNGTLSIKVTERSPILLAVDQTGHPGGFVDRNGVVLPVDTLSRYDVPLLRGVAGISDRSARIDDEATLELLDVLAARDDPSEDLISDIVVSDGSGLEIITVPFREGRCVRVKLGRGDYGRKLAKLAAFWEQAVIGRSNKSLEWIDLRFDGQVVTKET